MNGEAIYEKSNALATIHKLLGAHRGKLTLAVLPLRSTRKPRGRSAHDLYAKVNAVLLSPHHAPFPVEQRLWNVLRWLDIIIFSTLRPRLVAALEARNYARSLFSQWAFSMTTTCSNPGSLDLIIKCSSH